MARNSSRSWCCMTSPRKAREHSQNSGTSMFSKHQLSPCLASSSRTSGPSASACSSTKAAGCVRTSSRVNSSLASSDDARAAVATASLTLRCVRGHRGTGRARSCETPTACRPKTSPRHRHTARSTSRHSACSGGSRGKRRTTAESSRRRWPHS
ncbi:unnamed protein product [Prorocentrum cordatum]|uniref:Uncharacterized protein n=1 Tax=Prorocentrum cordatum TaxID=2364126 RepID=A0ABN9SCA6_9DINO|nr:unnamed protein product [Polarella glacialis]